MRIRIAMRFAAVAALLLSACSPPGIEIRVNSEPVAILTEAKGDALGGTIGDGSTTMAVRLAEPGRFRVSLTGPSIASDPLWTPLEDGLRVDGTGVWISVEDRQGYAAVGEIAWGY